MTFGLPDDLPIDWEDEIGMKEDAAFLNAVGGMNNSLKAAILAFFNGTARSFVATNEPTTSTSFTPLLSPGEAAVNVGDTGIVLAFLRCQLVNTVQAIMHMSCDLTGANTVSASTDNDISLRQPIASSTATLSMNGFIPYTGLNPGATIFKTRFLTSGGTAHFLNRELFLIPFP